jgi:hypothetical protein
MVLDAASWNVTSTLALPSAPTVHSLSVSPDGKLMALSAPQKGSISTQPAPNPGMQVTRFIQLGGSLTFVDTASFEVCGARTDDIGAPLCVAFGADHKHIYVVDKRKGVIVFRRP